MFGNQLFNIFAWRGSAFDCGLLFDAVLDFLRKSRVHLNHDFVPMLAY